MTIRSLLHANLCLALFAGGGSAGAANWPQFGYDAAHSGNNPAETRLTHANVGQVVRRYAATIPDAVDSAPVYLGNVATANGVKNLLFALSQSGKILAIDAATGSVVWSHPTGSGGALPSSSPAIDPGGAYVYSHGIDGKIHKYQVGDGTEITTGGWPQVYTLKPGVEKANGGLAIATTAAATYLYSVTSGYFDSGDYQGHVTTVNLGTGTQTVFNAVCSNVTTHFPGGNPCDIGSSSGGAAIWGRGGAVFDASRGKLYITTGNGPYTANVGNGMYWGDSVLSLAPDGTGATPGVPFDSYTPSNYAYLDTSDTDLGSMSIALLPVPPNSSIAHLGMQGGKDDGLRLINLDDMSGGGGPRHVGGELQLITNTHESYGAREQSAVWVDGSGVTWVFFASFRNGLTAYRMSLGASNVPMLAPVWTQYTGSSVGSTSPVVANGVLYHVGGCPSGSSNCVIARDPASGAALWTSESLGNVHFQSPIVVDGSIYVFDASAKLWAFGGNGSVVTHTVTPVAGSGGDIAPSTPQTVDDGATTAFTLTPAAHHRIDSVTGCGGHLAGNVYTTGPITADCTVSATFIEQTHLVTPVATESGTLSPATPQTVMDGEQIQFTATADVGHTLVGISGCAGSLAGTVYTTGPIVADCIVEAVFSGDEVIFQNGFDPAS